MWGNPVPVPKRTSPRAGTALVTGASSGIGLAFGRALAARGHDLVLVARDEQRLDAVAEDLRGRYGGDVEVISADLTADEPTARVAGRLADSTRPVALLVNNAGTGERLAFADNDLAAEEASLDLHVRAPMRLTHAALPGMRARRTGAIVNVSSVAGFLPRGTYGAHKAWVTSFTRWLDITHRPDGVRAMALCPGFVRTEFHQRMQVDMSGVPAWMWLDADDTVSEALHDLASGRRVSVPSRRYRLMSRTARMMPARLAAQVGQRGR
jgi:short-subunit dehydrogenase